MKHVRKKARALAGVVRQWRPELLLCAVALALVSAGGGPDWVIKTGKVSGATDVWKEIFDFLTASWGQVLPVVIAVSLLGGILATLKLRHGRHEGHEDLKNAALMIVLAIFAVPMIS